MAAVDLVRSKDIDAKLKEDKSWKKIQQNTFTRWVNQNLKKTNSSIQNLVLFCFL